MHTSQARYVLATLTTLALLLQPVSHASTTSATVMKDTALRAGAGAFNKKLALVKKGTTVTELAKQGFWVQVKTPSQTGWITKNVLSTYGPQSDAKAKRGLSGLRGAKPLIHVEKSVVVTATKGAFEESYTSKRGGQRAALRQLNQDVFDEKDYREFSRPLATKGNHIEAAEAFLGGLPMPGDLDPELEEILGKALAARLAATGLESNPRLLRYVNLVATRVGEHSDRPELHYRTFILKDKRPAAFALPGGYIFITRGLLSFMRSESELAGLIGHEIAHITRLHGLKSFKRAAVNAKAKSAFNELEAETQDDAPETVSSLAELESLADSMYEAMTGVHSRGMEREADVIGAAYAYHAGYDALGLSTLFDRIVAAKQLIFLRKPTTKSTHPPLDKRAKDVRSFVSKKGLSGGTLEKGRFIKTTR